MNHSTRVILLITCLLASGLLLSCSSTPGPDIALLKGNIVVNGIPDGIKCVKVTVHRQGMPDVEFPSGPGLPFAPIDGHTVKIPITQSSTPITVTGITVIIADDCGPAPFSGTWTYKGENFQLDKDTNHLVPWNDFKK